jgi:hypothetical protein
VPPCPSSHSSAMRAVLCSVATSCVCLGVEVDVVIVPV